MGISSIWIKRLEKLSIYIILCFGVAIVLKWGVVAGYSIPTSSMQPFLNGDPDTGDKVAVFKLQYKLFEPERYDLVVFFKEGEYPIESGFLERSGGMNFVKRLVGFPGEEIKIRKGDLYFNGAKAPDRKPLDLIQSLLIPVYRYRYHEKLSERWIPIEGARCLDNGSGPLVCDARSATKPRKAALRYRPVDKVINDDYLDDSGELHPGTQPVRDLALTLDVEFLEEGGRVTGRLYEEGDEFWFSLLSQAEGGGGMVGRNQKYETLSTDAFPGFQTGQSCTVTFINIDNRILLLVDDRPLYELRYDENTSAYTRNDDVYIGIQFGAQNAHVRFHGIHIDRDIHYTDNLGTHGVNSFYRIPEGRYFFLGDNSSESEDSRVFGVIPKEDLVGRPFMIFYPFSRMRVF